ncbi:hypothetical protein N0V90_008954 [Kalmusia sp. IMI 367209]|nr:hypothetical protein N0V90_008954 [Kalmusia sp. IMI 367209]
MAPAHKQGRKSNDGSGKKRKKTAPSPAIHDDDNDDDREWAFKAILEKKIAKKGELELRYPHGTIIYTSKEGELWYLIEWEDDPETGEVFENSWTPATNVTGVESPSWETQEVVKAATTTRSDRDRASTPNRQRRRRIVESSEPSTPPSVQSTPAISTHSSPSPKPKRTSPRVEINPRNPSSLESFQSLSLSQQELQLSYLSPVSSIASSQSWSLHETSTHHSTGVVLDSESEDEVEDNPSASYLPPTQNTRTTGSASHPHTSSTSEDTDIPISLEESQTPHSPSISIPETEPEHNLVSFSDQEHGAAEDSLVLSQPEDHQEIPDAFQTGASLSQTIAGGSVAQVPLSGREQYEHALQTRSSDTAGQPSGEVDRGDQTTLLDSITEPSPSKSQHEIFAVETEVQSRELSAIPLVEEAELSPVEDSETHLHEQDTHASEPKSLILVSSSTSQEPPFKQQNAQTVPTNIFLSTQDEGQQSVRAIIGQDIAIASPRSRHDSSQESPKPIVTSTNISSPAPQPPPESLQTLDTNVLTPPRIETHDSSSSSMTMDEQTVQILAELKQEAADNVKRKIAARRSVQQAPSETGTRSPSTIPNSLPISQVPTSLRTVAISRPAPEPAEPQTEKISDDQHSNAMDTDTEFATNVVEPMDDDQPSDSNDEDSLLNDELQLQDHEYIVPLPMEGRQKIMYQDTIKKYKEVLDNFVLQPQEADQHEVEKAFHELRSIETHVDLVWNRNDSSQPPDTSASRDQHLVQWSYDNSVKFRYMGALFDKLRELELHAIIVIENEDNKRLFQITESFLRGKHFNFESPITGQTASAINNEGRLRITILSSTSSHIVRPADLIVCLDGSLEAAKIWTKSWARKPDESHVRCLHLVIPLAIGHIERCLSPNLDARKKLHTITATLAQFNKKKEIGKAVDRTTPRTNEAATNVVRFLFPLPEEPSLSEWPLPGIGSIKKVVEFQSQKVPDIAASPISASNAASKRPLVLDDDRVDPPKRMRFTPQPQIQLGNDTSHISDPVTGTSLGAGFGVSDRQLYDVERKRFREVEKSFSKQQLVHEETSRKNRELNGRIEELGTKLEASLKREATMKKLLETRKMENVELSKRFSELEDAQSLSPNEQIVKITQLTKELTEAKKSAETAVCSKISTENTLEYVQDQYRTLQTQHGDLEKDFRAAVAQEIKLKREASGKAQETVRLHHERQDRLAAQKATGNADQTKILKRQLFVKSQECDRMKAEIEKIRATRGVGGGTRAATPGTRTPRPGSRAASPAQNGRDRLSNLRNG